MGSGMAVGIEVIVVGTVLKANPCGSSGAWRVGEGSVRRRPGRVLISMRVSQYSNYQGQDSQDRESCHDLYNKSISWAFYMGHGEVSVKSG